MSQQSEVKEYFIDTDSYANPSDSVIGFESMAADMIHVILKSEYDKLKDELQKDLDLAMQIMNELGKENQNLQTLLGECMTAFATLRDEFHPPSDAYKLAEAFLQKIKAARGSNEQIP